MDGSSGNSEVWSVKNNTFINTTASALS